MILQVRKLGDPVLRQLAQEVAAVTPHVIQLLDDMLETMAVENGVGLAAPQVGISQQLVVIGLGKKVFRLINPAITAASGEQVSYEACLSVPDAEGEVLRAAKVTVHYLDERGKKRRVTATGLLARVVQHELDHLHGVLFVDRLDARAVVTDPAGLASLRDSRLELRGAA
jgi:peptide deformylase